MFPILPHSRFIYILSNLLVLPAAIFPHIDFLSNLAFVIAAFMLFKSNVLLILPISLVFIIKNNSNYRFNLLLKHKGVELAKSDEGCVYLYAWCTLLRYLLIGIATNEVVLFFNK